MFNKEQLSRMTAEDIIRYIANDYVELSHDKVLLQRNDYIKTCREWLKSREVAQQARAGDS